jgi:hypothetical protein
VSEDSSRTEWLPQARSYLRHADPVLARLIDDRPDFDPRAWMAQLPPMDLHGALLFQVTGQQLSVPATRRTLARIQALFGGHLPAPAELLAVGPSQLRERQVARQDTPGRSQPGGHGCSPVRRAGPGPRLHITSRQIGTGYFQETKPEFLFEQASHFCETVAR